MVKVTMTALREQNPEKRDMLFLYKVTGQPRQQLTACMIPARHKINIKWQGNHLSFLTLFLQNTILVKNPVFCIPS